MDIQRIRAAGAARASDSSNKSTEAKITFQEIMKDGRRQGAYDQFGQKLEAIEKQGKRLADSRTVDELRLYKKMVKEFMDEAVKLGLQLEEQRGFNRRGRTKVYKIVKEVDSKLIDLTDSVLRGQQKGLHLLKQTGEIQGLLVNIYA
ncbi:YaaR family protein [Alkalicoccus luteus]|uniref:YaaR family protein n=1 Tax=Alkalicoccus luteus TaxID=1237094 RepID=UPI004033244B